MTGGLDSPLVTGTTAVVASMAIQALKNSGWATWFNRQTDRANLALSIAVAIATTAGIHWTFDTASGNGTILFNIHQIWGALSQWVAQHIAYKQFIVPSETMGEIRAMMQKLLPPPISKAEEKTQEAHNDKA